MTTLAPDALSLNDRQLEAASHRGGPLIVLAGPGTGKTRVIIARIAGLIGDGADPASILAVTFTIRAAEQMRARLASSIGRSAAEAVQIHTFHAWGSRVVARFGDCIGVPPIIRIIDSAQEKRALAEIVRDPAVVPDRALHTVDGLVAMARHFIGACRTAARSPGQALAFASEWPTPDEGLDEEAIEADRARRDEFAMLARVYERFEGECLARGNLSYDHFITLPIRIMREVPHAASIIRSELRHVVVDEFQDVNSAQLEMLRCIVPPTPDADVCVVGDDDQAIYGFRGSDPRAFAHFDATWTGARTVTLVENYRSTTPILDVSDAFVERTPARFSPDKRIVAAGESAGAPAEPVLHVMAPHDDDAGAVIARLIEDDRARSGADLSSYAVIARTHTQLQKVSVQLQLAGLPVHYRTKASLLDDPAVADVLAWIRVLVNPHDVASALRLLRRPPVGADLPLVHDLYQRYRAESGPRRTGPGFVRWLGEPRDTAEPVACFLDMYRRLDDVAAAHPADRAVFAIVQETGLADLDPLPASEQARRIDHMARVVRFARSIVTRLQVAGDLREFVEYYDDLDSDEQGFNLPTDSRLDADSDDDAGTRPGAVSLLTAHGAKGLEFDTVFLPYVRKRGYPASPRRDDFDPLPEAFTGSPRPEHETEERRLFYVAMTRAQRRLVMISGSRKTNVDDYCSELQSLGAAAPIDFRTPEDLGEADVRSDELSRERIAAGPAPEDPLEGARADVRAEIHSLLHRASSDTLDPDGLRQLQRRLALSVEKLAALGRSGTTRDDGFLDSLDEGVRTFVSEQRERASAAAPAHAMRVPEPPLDLSFTSIDLYDRCPRCYYARYVLGLPERFGDPVIVGNAVHGALERFYREFASAEAEGLARPGLDRLLELGAMQFEALWPAFMAEDADQRHRVEALLRCAFNDLHHDGIHVLEVEHAVRRMPIVVDGTEHYLTAKIDRIDQVEDEQGIMYRVVDYKTGNATQKLLKPAKTDLQLGIYTMALSHLYADGQEIPPGVAEYWVLSAGQVGRIDLATINLAKIEEKIRSCVRGILAGGFERGTKCSNACELLG